MLKIFARNSSKKHESNSLDKYYKSIIDLPVWNWWQLHEKSDYTFILLDKKSQVCDSAKRAVENLQEDFINHFGIDPKYREQLKLRCDIELAWIKQAITGDKSSYLLIKVKEQKLKAMFTGEKESSYFTAVVALEKFLGRKIDVRKESTFDVYSYLNELKTWQKAKR